MITKHKKDIIIGSVFVAIIIFLILDVIKKASLIDVVYLIFIVGCFIRFIYIKTHPKGLY